MSPVLILSFAAAVLAAAPAAAETPPDLDAALKEKAARIIKYAESKDCKNIAVLKFLVRTGDGPFSDDVGELNMNLARRLTVALVLADPNEKIGIVGNANEALAGSSANHLDEEGRLRCFKAKGFVLAWGDPQIAADPDLFVTGRVTLSKDLKETSVQLLTFGKDGKLDESLRSFTVPTTTRTLIDTGHSYQLPQATVKDLVSRGRPKEDEDNVAVDLSGKYNAEQKDPTVSTEHQAPVRLKIHYGDREIPVKDGAVPEPSKDDQVWFELKNVSPEIHGVVLKINGENTIYRERVDDRDCHKWILKPGETVFVRGYQTKLTKREDFRVLPPEASKEGEVRYGEHAGTFHVSIFRAKGENDPPAAPPMAPAIVPPATVPPTPPPVIPTAKDDYVAAIARGSLRIKGQQPDNLKALQSELKAREGRELANATSRGLVDSDSENPKDHKVEVVKFVPSPTIPVWTQRIRYYVPAGGK